LNHQPNPGEENMLGIVFQGDRTLELQQFPDPTPGPGEVILEIKASGMCGSDLHVYANPANEKQGRSSPGMSHVA
jgi:D-arabinose 1-dehydrogenase-like Zn-dependent alcohol dehydrogenase